MRRLGLWKVLVPPAAVPLALSVFVALAGPGGVIEVDDDFGSTPERTDASDSGGDEAGCFLSVLRDGAHSYIVLQEHVSDPDKPEGGVAGNQSALDKICFGALGGSQANTTFIPGESVDDPGKSGDAPGKSEDTPGESEDTPDESEDTPTQTTDQTATGPGKSEQAPGEPTAGGNANGEGQENADTNGNGPTDAQGQNKPAKDEKP